MLSLLIDDKIGHNLNILDQVVKRQFSIPGKVVALAVAITGTGPIVIVQVDIRRENDIGGRGWVGIPVAGGCRPKPVMAV